MGKCCLHASSFIFDGIIIKVAGNQGRNKSSNEFDFGPDQTTLVGVTCPWMTKNFTLRTLISLRLVGQSWSNLMCSIIVVGKGCIRFWGRLVKDHIWPWHIGLRWTIVALCATCFHFNTFAWHKFEEFWLQDFQLHWVSSRIALPFVLLKRNKTFCTTDIGSETDKEGIWW